MDDRAADRRAMIERQIRRRGVRDPRVLEALLRVPRHEFVPPDSQDRAYADHPLPIGSDLATTIENAVRYHSSSFFFWSANRSAIQLSDFRDC